MARYARRYRMTVILDNERKRCLCSLVPEGRLEYALVFAAIDGALIIVSVATKAARFGVLVITRLS